MSLSVADPFSRRPLGSTGLEVTGICFGAAPLGDMGGTFNINPGEERSLATLRSLLESPIRFLDTAAGYGDGTSERRVGMALAAIGGLPADMVIATKADPDAKTGDFSGDQCRRSVERSQKLLGLDFLPLVYLHDPEYHDDATLMATGGAVDALVDMQREGIVGAIGIGGGDIATMHRYLELGVFTVMLTHNRFNLLNRSGDGLIDDAIGRGIAVCNAAPYGSGILAKGPKAYPRFMYKDAEEETLRNAEVLERLANRHGVPLAAVALQFSLRDPRISSTVVGMSRPERVEETVALAQHPIPGALWEELSTLPFSVTEGV